MPFGRCPVCGAGYHLSVGLPIDEWYRRHWPGVPVGAEVPGECLRCWLPPPPVPDAPDAEPGAAADSRGRDGSH